MSRDYAIPVTSTSDSQSDQRSDNPATQSLAGARSLAATPTHAAKGEPPEPPEQPDTTNEHAIAIWVDRVGMWLDDNELVDEDFLEFYDKHFDRLGFDYVNIRYTGGHATQRTVRQAIKDTVAVIAWARGTKPPPAWLNGSHPNNQGEP